MMNDSAHAPQTLIDKLYEENAALIEFLKLKDEVSFQVAVDQSFRKVLVLAIASYFETILTEDIKKFFREYADAAEITVFFIENKAINRQYHTFFDWEGKNANRFFALFGSEFKLHMEKQVAADPTLEKSIKAFLELGNSRNNLVHRNFASQTLGQTTEEIYEQYKLALSFVQGFPQRLRDFIAFVIASHDSNIHV